MAGTILPRRVDDEIFPRAAAGKGGVGPVVLDDEFIERARFGQRRRAGGRFEGEAVHRRPATRPLILDAARARRQVGRGRSGASWAPGGSFRRRRSTTPATASLGTNSRRNTTPRRQPVDDSRRLRAEPTGFL